MDLAEFINKRYQHIIQQCLATLHFNALCQQFYLTLLHFSLFSLPMTAFTDISLKYNLHNWLIQQFKETESAWKYYLMAIFMIQKIFPR